MSPLLHLWGVSNTLKLSVLPLFALLLTSCSRHKTVTPEELRSHLLSAISVATEAEIFIDYIRANRVTRNYAHGHINYLADQLERSSQELQAGVPDTISEEKLRMCRLDLDALNGQLGVLPQLIGDPNALTAAKERIARLRQTLEETDSSL